MLLTVDNVTQPLAEWALDYGIPCALIHTRLKRGWTNERAVTEPMEVNSGAKLKAADMRERKAQRYPRGTKITFAGTTLNISEWAARTGVSYQALKGRLRNGWSLERALTAPRRIPELIAFGGEALTVTDWAARIGITEPALRSRLNNPAWTLEEALTLPNVRGCRSDLGKRPA